MEATKALSEEHQFILKITDALMREANALKSGKELDKGFFEKATDFIRNYADRFHHAKEEDILFAELNKSEGMHCNPVQQMLYEHDLGRDFVKGIEEGLKEKDKVKVTENARGYAQLLQEHIFKEDNILYPMAEEALKPQIKSSILEKFKQAENKKFAKGTKEKYLAIAKEFDMSEIALDARYSASAHSKD